MVHDTKSEEQRRETVDKLADLLATTVPTVPIGVFKSHYLPQLVDPDNRHGVRDWLAVAQSHFTSVDVLNADGTVAFRVPPLMVPPPTRMSNDLPSSIAANVDVAIRKQRIIPAMGLNYFREVIPTMIGKTPSQTEHVKQWNSILVSCGYDPIIENVEEVPHETHKVDTLVTDGYDEV